MSSRRNRGNGKRVSNRLAAHVAGAAKPSFEAQVGSRVTPRANGCWSFGDTDQPYPQMRCFGEVVAVHRWLFEQLVGPIAEGHQLHHRCFDPTCVNPSHLQPVTAAEHRRIHRDRGRS